MTGMQIVLLVILGLCIGASGFLSGSETAVVAVPRERVHQFADRDRRGARLAALTDDPDRTIGTLLVANNFVNILGASAATTLAIELVGEPWGTWLSALSFTAVILVVGEITPKTLAARYPAEFALTVAPAIWLLAAALQPIARVFVAISRALLRLFGVRTAGHLAVTEEDIRTMVRLGEQAGEIEQEEREIIDALFALADRPVREVMTPRVAIVTLQAPVSGDGVRHAVAATGHSRFPVIGVDGDLDHLEGILHVKDLLRSRGELDARNIHRLLREPHYVPESSPVLTVLQQMRLQRVGFAVVLDEHGGVDGIVTVKDLVSELVGELQDEYDPGTPEIVRVSDTTWITDGRLPVEELADATQQDLPAGPYATAAGLFLFVSGTIPDEGATVEVAGITMTVLRMDRRRIDELRVEVPTDAMAPAKTELPGSG